MSNERGHLEYLNGFMTSLWPAAGELFGAEITHAAAVGFNGDEPPDDEPPDDDGPADPNPSPVPPLPEPVPQPVPQPQPVPPVDPRPPGGPGDPELVLQEARSGARGGTGAVIVPDGDPRRTTEDALKFLRDHFKQLGRSLAELVVRPKLRETSTRMNLDLLPAVRANGADGLRVLLPPGRGFPPEGHHEFRSRVEVFGKVVGQLTNFRVELRIPLEIRFSKDAEPEIVDDRITVHTDAVGSVADRLNGWKAEALEQLDTDEFRDELGFLLSARYARDAVGAAPAPQPVLTNRPAVEGAVNVVLVPDGFATSDPGGLDRFDRVVAAARRRLFEPDDRHLNEPLFSFKSALNLWTLVPDQTVNGDHVVAAYRPGEQSSPKVALGNLARLAAIGAAAERALSGLTILVFVANHEADRFGDRPPRAMALGKVILQPTNEEDPGDVHAAAARWADVLLHELGHTPLGNLADEYVDRDRRHVRYRGQEREAANLDASWLARRWDRGDRDLANLTSRAIFRRWRDWIDHELPPWDQHPITAVQGGGYFGRWIWRPAEDCAMGNTDELTAPFCAICREALTRGLRDALPAGRFMVEVSDHSRRSEVLTVEPERPGATTITEHLRVAPRGATEIRITVIAGTLPEPWEISARLAGGGELQEHRDQRFVHGAPTIRTGWTFRASDGDRLIVEIGSGCPFVPFDEISAYTIELRCVIDPADVQPPRSPSGLAAEQTGGGPAGTPQTARLSATTEDPQGQDVRLEFEVARDGRQFTNSVTERTPWLSAPAGSPVEGRVSHRAIDGRYRVQARARNRSGRTSPWSSALSFSLVMPQPGNGPGDDRDRVDGPPGTGGPETP